MKQLIDCDEFLDEYSESIEIIEMMLPKFHDSVGASIGAITDYYNKKDLKQLSSELHSIKGVIGNLFSPWANTFIVGLEEKVRSNNLENFDQSIVVLEENLYRILDEAKELVKLKAG